MRERLPDDAYAVALTHLSQFSPKRFWTFLKEGSAREILTRFAKGDRKLVPLVTQALTFENENVPRGNPDQTFARWVREAQGLDVALLWKAIGSKGFGVCVHGSHAYPSALIDDPLPPAVLYHAGSLDHIAGPRVGIVGTRSCTSYGRDVAYELGEGLSAAGVAVVSGLAKGIDAAAHSGALAGGTPPIAVVGSGLDVVYPKQNAKLWDRIAAGGLVLTEAPLGGQPEAWRFPSRNRLIAALSDVVVVVESHAAGGSLVTLRQAVERERAVFAVPGPVRSPASKGTNDALAEGANIARDTNDVLIGLGLAGARPAAEHRPAPDPGMSEVLDALGWQPATFEQLANRTGLRLGELALMVDRLESTRWIERRGGWLERVARDRVG